MSHRATSWLSHIPATRLSNSEFRVLFHLCDCHNPSQGCFPTQGYLISATGVSNGTLNNALNDLESKGLIARHKRWDKKTKRQRPTRYMLGFEIEKPQEPTPETGDGADSKKHPDPSPKNGQSRLQPTGEKPVSKPVNNQRGGARGGESAIPETLVRWAKAICDGAYVPVSAITIGQAQLMLRNDLVTEAHLRALGIAF